MEQQKAFEEHIELLINYKKFHPKESVYINERCMKKAVKWYQSQASMLQESGLLSTSDGELPSKDTVE